MSANGRRRRRSREQVDETKERVLLTCLTLGHPFLGFIAAEVIEDLHEEDKDDVSNEPEDEEDERHRDLEWKRDIDSLDEMMGVFVIIGIGAGAMLLYMACKFAKSLGWL